MGSNHGPGPHANPTFSGVNFGIEGSKPRLSGPRRRFMTEAQAEKILKELRTIKVCVIILTVIITLASAKATFNL